MSAHLEHETLWSLAKNELDAAALATANQHLGACAHVAPPMRKAAGS